METILRYTCNLNKSAIHAPPPPQRINKKLFSRSLYTQYWGVNAEMGMYGSRHGLLLAQLLEIVYLLTHCILDVSVTPYPCLII